jgi:hypothetical protein
MILLTVGINMHVYTVSISCNVDIISRFLYFLSCSLYLPFYRFTVFSLKIRWWSWRICLGILLGLIYTTAVRRLSFVLCQLLLLDEYYPKHTLPVAISQYSQTHRRLKYDLYMPYIYIYIYIYIYMHIYMAHIDVGDDNSYGALL